MLKITIDVQMNEFSKPRFTCIMHIQPRVDKTDNSHAVPFTYTLFTYVYMYVKCEHGKINKTEKFNRFLSYKDRWITSIINVVVFL